MFAVSLVLVGTKLLKALWIETHYHKKLLEKLCGEVLGNHTWESNIVAAWGKRVWFWEGEQLVFRILVESF